MRRESLGYYYICYTYKKLCNRSFEISAWLESQAENLNRKPWCQPGKAQQSKEHRMVDSGLLKIPRKESSAQGGRRKSGASIPGTESGKGAGWPLSICLLNSSAFGMLFTNSVVPKTPIPPPISPGLRDSFLCSWSWGGESADLTASPKFLPIPPFKRSFLLSFFHYFFTRH